MSDLYFLPGRVFAKDKEHAKILIVESARKKGFEIVGNINPYLCGVQTKNDELWFEFYVEVVSDTNGF